MSCWAILGINPTKNIDVIKDAYTELSNSTNANELIKLKSAYNKALSLAKTSINDLNLSLLGSSNFDILSALINSSIDSKSIDTIDKFIDEANEIYNNPVLRFNIDSWVNLLTSPILESSSKELASIELIKFLSNHKYLTTKTYKLFDTKFNWIKNKDKLSSVSIDLENYTTEQNVTVDQTSMDKRIQDLYEKELEKDIKNKIEEQGYKVASCKVNATILENENSNSEENTIQKIKLKIEKKKDIEKSNQDAKNVENKIVTEIQKIKKVNTTIGNNTNNEDTNNKETDTNNFKKITRQDIQDIKKFIIDEYGVKEKCLEINY